MPPLGQIAGNKARAAVVVYRQCHEIEEYESATISDQAALPTVDSVKVAPFVQRGKGTAVFGRQCLFFCDHGRPGEVLAGNLC
jgi:hypothetical protein